MADGESLDRPLERLDAKLTQIRGELDAAAVVADATQGKRLVSEIEAVVAQREELDRQLVELVGRARRLGVPVRHLTEALELSLRAFFQRDPA